MASYKKILAAKKATQWILLGAFLVMPIAYFFSSSADGNQSDFFFVAGVLFVIIVALIFSFGVAESIVANSIIVLLERDCEPAKYLRQVEDAPEQGKNTDYNLANLQHASVIADVMLDKVEEARRITSKLVMTSYAAKNDESRAYLLMLTCSAAKFLESEELFEEQFVRLENITKIKRAKGVYAKSAHKYYRDVVERKELEEKEDWNALVGYSDRMLAYLKRDNCLSRVRLQLRKAEYLRKAGRCEEAGESLRFVIEHGKELPYVQQAKEMLEELPEAVNVDTSKEEQKV